MPADLVENPPALRLTAERLSALFVLPLDLVRRDGYYNLW
jgi:hypothetical protein